MRTELITVPYIDLTKLIAYFQTYYPVDVVDGGVREGEGSFRKFLSFLRGIYQDERWFNRNIRESSLSYDYRANRKFIGGSTITKGHYKKGGEYEHLYLALIHGVQDYLPLKPQIVLVEIRKDGNQYRIKREDYLAGISLRECKPMIPLELMVANASYGMLVQ